MLQDITDTNGQRFWPAMPLIALKMKGYLTPKLASSLDSLF